MAPTAPALDLSTAITPRLVWRERSASTNAELVAASGEDDWPDFAVLATDDQTAGRGRLGRQWVAAPGRALAISVLLRPAIRVERLGWIPLIAGLAAARAADRFLADGRVSVKWPNDVLVGDRKLCGVLSELTPSGAVVVGVGINTMATDEELPVPTATSLVREGASDVTVDAVLSAYLSELAPLYEGLVRSGGGAVDSGVLAAVSERCGTIGARVRLDLPGGSDVEGTARGIDADGRLVVELPDGAGLLPVSAGDVTHVRRSAE